MNDQDIRETLARFEGFVAIDESYDCFGEQGVVTRWKLYGPHGVVLKDGLPDYPRDLNAINDLVIKARFKNQFFFLDYQRELWRVVKGREWNKDIDYQWSISMFEVTNATASQRCAAVLRVICSWKEVKETIIAEVGPQEFVKLEYRNAKPFIHWVDKDILVVDRPTYGVEEKLMKLLKDVSSLRKMEV